MPGVVVEADAVGLDGGVQLAGAQLDGQRHAAVPQSQVHVVVSIPCELKKVIFGHRVFI